VQGEAWETAKKLMNWWRKRTIHQDEAVGSVSSAIAAKVENTSQLSQLAETDNIPFVRPTSGIAARLRPSPNRDYFFGLILIAITLLAYQPAWNGKPIMDDAGHLTTSENRPLSGLGRLWIDPRTDQQYHPLVDTLFWVEDKLWGGSMLGYHIVNILLHGVSALLLWKILQQLQVPGALLAAAIFALHPVQVESVAFLVELKNTLSGVFLFAAALVYLRFDKNRDRKSYALVLVLFFAGLFAKTIVAMLPAAILIALWWKRGRLEWKRDVMPLLPFVVLGIAAGACTGWMEREFSGAKGVGFEFSMIERFLIAGRAFWFYLGKIFWPSNLMLIYSRWNIDSTAWWQYVFPSAALVFVAAAWALRRRWPWLLAGLLFFTVMVLPILGFHSMRIFRFQFVSDHFQYLPVIGIITPVSAGAAMFLNRLRGRQRTIGYGFCLALLATLTFLTWQHSRMFRDSETCYRTVLEKNPDAWPAQYNLAIALLKKGSVDEATAYFEKVLQTRPKAWKLADSKDSGSLKASHLQLGFIKFKKGLLDEATFHFEEVLKMGDSYKAHNSLGSVLHRQGRFREAVLHFEEALKLAPDSPATENNLAWVLATAPDPSLRNGAKAVELAQLSLRVSDGKDPLFLHTLAAAYAETGQFPRALEVAERALSLSSDPGLLYELRVEIGLYELSLPYHQTPR